MIGWPRFRLSGPHATRRRRSGEIVAVVVLALVLIGLYAVARHSGPFQIVEGQFLDWRFQARGPLAPSTDIAIVTIDDRTLDAIGRWPFSRRWLAKTLHALRADGAETIVLDLLLTGSARGEAEAAISSRFPSPRAETEDTADPRAVSEDEVLAAAIAEAPQALIPYAFTFEQRAAPAPELPGPIKRTAFRIVQKGGDRGSEPVEASGLLLPQGRFLESGIPGHVSVFYEGDGKVRFAHPLVRYRDNYYPSLPLEAVRLHLGADRSEMAVRFGEAVSIGGHRYPLEAKQRLAINFLGPAETFPRYSLIDVANGEVAEGAFRDRLVLIGATATGLGDRFATPFAAGLNGVELLATVADNLLLSRPLQRDGWSAALDLLAIALAAAVTLTLRFLNRPATLFAGASALIGLWTLVNGYAFAEFHLWLNFTFPLLALLGGAGSVMIGRTLSEHRQRVLAERRTHTLSHYVSPLTTVGLEGAANTPAPRGDRTAAIVFLDLVGYTAASEQLPRETAAAILRDFYELVEQQCSAHGGVVDKYIGDGAMLVFGIPSAGPADAANAIRCAQAIVTAMNRPREPALPDRAAPISCGCGIHCGTVQLVELGSKRHRQITVTGDTVNVASRLEALTRDWQVQVIVSGEVIAAARGAGHEQATMGFERLPADSVRGRSQSIELWAWKLTA